MNFSTNTKILSAIAVSGVIAYMFIAKEPAKVENIHRPKQIEQTAKEEKKPVEILYLDSGKTKRTATNKKSYAKTDTNENITNFYNDEKKIKQYIEKKGLVEVTPKKQNSDGSFPRYSVYSTINRQTAKQNRDTTLPPSAPAIISGIFTSGTPYTVIVDGDIKAQAKELVITDNNPDGTINEAVVVPKQQLSHQETNNDNTQENIKLTAPPSIQQ